MGNKLRVIIKSRGKQIKKENKLKRKQTQRKTNLKENKLKEKLETADLHLSVFNYKTQFPSFTTVFIIIGHHLLVRPGRETKEKLV